MGITRRSSKLFLFLFITLCCTLDTERLRPQVYSYPYLYLSIVKELREWFIFKICWKMVPVGYLLYQRAAAATQQVVVVLTVTYVPGTTGIPAAGRYYATCCTWYYSTVPGGTVLYQGGAYQFCNWCTCQFLSSFLGDFFENFTKLLKKLTYQVHVPLLC